PLPLGRYIRDPGHAEVPWSGLVEPLRVCGRSDGDNRAGVDHAADAGLARGSQDIRSAPDVYPPALLPIVVEVHHSGEVKQDVLFAKRRREEARFVERGNLDFDAEWPQG